MKVMDELHSSCNEKDRQISDLRYVEAEKNKVE